MSNILYVIDGYLSSEDKVSVTKELIQQLKKLDPNRKILLINKFNNSWGLEDIVDYYREYLDGFMVGYPPQELIDNERYSRPYVYFQIDSGTLENWMPFVGVSDHVANVYNGFIYSIKEAQNLGFDKVFRIEYDMLFEEEEFKDILIDLDSFENEDYLIYGRRHEGYWAKTHQSLIDVHFCGYSVKCLEGFDFVKNDKEYWDICEKIGYFGKWAEYVMSMIFESNITKGLNGKIYLDKVRDKYPLSQFDRISSSGEWSDKWKEIPKICRLDRDKGYDEDKDKVVIFYLNMDYDYTEIETISNKNYYRKVQLGRNGWTYDIIDRNGDMIFMTKMTTENGTNTEVTHINNQTYDKLNCRFILR